MSISVTHLRSLPRALYCLLRALKQGREQAMSDRCYGLHARSLSLHRGCWVRLAVSRGTLARLTPFDAFDAQHSRPHAC